MKQDRRGGAGPPAVAGVVGVIAVLGMTFGHLLGPFDFLTFFHAGRAVLDGRSPYVATSSLLFRSGHAFVYPVFVAWMFVPLAMFPKETAEIAYTAAGVVAITSGCRLLGRRGWGTPALVLVSSTTIIGLQMGTINAFLLLSIACAWYWRESRPLLAGAALGVAAAAKLFLLPVLVWPFLRRRYSSGAAGALVAGLAVSTSTLGSMSLSGYVHMLSKLEADELVSSWSLSSLWRALGASRLTASCLSMSVVGAGLLFLFIRRRAVSDGQTLGAAVVLSLLASPILWSSYLLLLVVPLLLATRGSHALALVSVVSWAIVTPDAASIGRVAIGAALALVVAATVAGHAGIDLRRRRLRQLIGPMAPLPVALALAAVAALVLACPPQVRAPLVPLALVAAVAFACVRSLAASDAAVTASRGHEGTP